MEERFLDNNEYNTLELLYEKRHVGGSFNAKNIKPMPDFCHLLKFSSLGRFECGKLIFEEGERYDHSLMLHIKSSVSPFSKPQSQGSGKPGIPIPSIFVPAIFPSLGNIYPLPSPPPPIPQIIYWDTAGDIWDQDEHLYTDYLDTNSQVYI